MPSPDNDVDLIRPYADRLRGAIDAATTGTVFGSSDRVTGAGAFVMIWTDPDTPSSRGDLSAISRCAA